MTSNIMSMFMYTRARARESSCLVSKDCNWLFFNGPIRVGSPLSSFHLKLEAGPAPKSSVFF